MKLILQVASEISKIYDFEFTLRTEHILHALNVISIAKSFERAVIYEVFGYEHEHPLGDKAEEFRPVDIMSVLSSNNVSCTEEVLVKLAEIQALGVDLYKNVTYSYFDGELPIDYTQDIVASSSLPEIIKEFSEKDLNKLMNSQKLRQLLQ